MAHETLKTGTTTLGFTFKDGIVLAADRRATMGSVNIDAITKIHPIIGKIYLTTAGSVSDNQYILKLLRAEARLKELETRRPVLIDELAHLMSIITFSNRDPFTGGLQVGILLGGVDPEGPKLYEILGDGVILTHPKYATVGSGSYFILNLLDELYKEDMSEAEAETFARQLITAAARRDIFSGNGVDIIIISREGEPRHLTEDFPLQLREA